MMGFKVFGLMVMVQAVMLLVVSFFVLFALRKIEKGGGLKVFGYVIVALLWVAAIGSFSTGVYKISKGRSCVDQGMMKQHMRGMMKEKPGSPMMKK